MISNQQLTANIQRPTTSLAQPSWNTNLRAVYAVAAKDWRQYWRYPLNAVSSVLQPLVWLTPVYFMGQAFSVNGKALGFAGLQRHHRLHLVHSDRHGVEQLHQRGLLGHGLRPEE